MEAEAGSSRDIPVPSHESYTWEKPAMSVRRIERREIHPASPLQIYLHDINGTPLLSAEEERDWRSV